MKGIAEAVRVERGWVELAMQMFIRNFERFAADQPLENIVDKKAGY